MKPNDFETRIRELTEPALKELAKMLKSRKLSADNKLKVIELIMERGYGKSASTSRDPWIEEFKGVDITKILEE